MKTGRAIDINAQRRFDRCVSDKMVSFRVRPLPPARIEATCAAIYFYDGM